jgi:hypothetical protein
MNARTNYAGRRARHLGRAINAMGLFSSAGEGAAKALPESVSGYAQIYDGVTFDLM